MKKTYVEFLYPGLFFAAIAKAKYKKGMRIPHGAYAYRVFKRQEKTMGGETLRGKSRYEPGTYYVPGSVVTQAKDVPRVFAGDKHHILRDNVRINGYKAVVKTPLGNVVPFMEHDVVLRRRAVA